MPTDVSCVILNAVKDLERAISGLGVKTFQSILLQMTAIVIKFSMAVIFTLVW